MGRRMGSWIDGCMYGWLDWHGWMVDGWMDGWWMDGWMDGYCALTTMLSIPFASYYIISMSLQGNYYYYPHMTHEA
jgi:hypothetical protein